MSRKGGARVVRGKFYARVRIGDGKRAQAQLSGCSTEAEANERAGIIAEVAQILVDAGRAGDVQEFADKLGAARDAKSVRILRLAAQKRAGTTAPITAGETLAQLAERWTSGALAKLYPDHIRTKDHREDRIYLREYILPHLGALAVTAITLDDCDRCMAALDAPAGSAHRRHVAQVIHRLMAIAAYPAKLITVSPIPKGWLPKLGPAKAKSYLYPDEDRKLLRCKDVDLPLRMLFGFLDREGCRASEAVAIEWSDLDLKRGSINLDVNKTNDPRAWALDAGVVRALRWWKGAGAPKAGPFVGMSTSHLAERLRESLRAAGVTREALFENTERRTHFQAHHLRVTFVTLNLAAGKTETWVQDRTGHQDTAMVNRYRRAARTAAELGIGNLTPLDRAIPEAGARMGHGRRTAQDKKGANKS
jgi:integrase